VLPASFFQPNRHGLITAVAFGFMSASPDRAVTISYMESGAPNVLWVMHCTAEEAQTGHIHGGAVLQQMSQYPAEAETLFPPMTMLQVLREGGDEDTTGAFRVADKEGTNKKGETVRYKEIHVRPSFA
jgi:hypothetical protein